LTLETSADPAGLTARARPEARPERARQTSRLVPIVLGWTELQPTSLTLSLIVNPTSALLITSIQCFCVRLHLISENVLVLDGDLNSRFLVLPPVEQLSCGILVDVLS
jgi:hypothetical protein